MTRIVATAATGTESLVVHELRGLGLSARAERAGMVSFAGGRQGALRAAVHVRVASRILEEAASFACDGRESLYEGVRAIDWPLHVTARTTIAVRAKVAPGAFATSTFAAQVVKDGIVDRIRGKGGQRPSVDRGDPDVLVVLHLGRGRAEVFLDVGGGPLHRRGYRVVPTDAPLKETLAAAVVLFGRHDPSAPFCDPMTGSGTLAIEAAMVSRRIAPRALARLGVERWASFDETARKALDEIRQEARAAVLPWAPAAIRASDVDPRVLDAARANARAAGVAGDITFERRDARTLESSAGALIAVNPPYGDRLEAPDDLARAFARRIRSLKDARLIALCASPAFARALGEPAWSREVRNGPIPCRIAFWTIRRR